MKVTIARTTVRCYPPFAANLNDVADISRFADYSRILFTAENKTADQWMRDNFDRYTLQFDLPEELPDALAFEKAATDAGLAVDPA
ncbi:MAG: hypothetical protein INH40_08845 [Acidobacteriaceae bacterium]|jgi:hypothetical protein|nr:hypothetical protein [Acidobacteriaceae bacterium]